MLIDKFVAISLLITAAPHVVQPDMWVTFFRVLLEARIAAVVITIYTLPLGLALLLSHTDWTWGTQWFFIVMGLGLTFKSTLYALAPRVADKMIREKGSRPENYRIGGLILLAAGLPMTWIAFA